jgi:hypothetical protein
MESYGGMGITRAGLLCWLPSPTERTCTGTLDKSHTGLPGELVEPAIFRVTAAARWAGTSIVGLPVVGELCEPAKPYGTNPVCCGEES